MLVFDFWFVQKSLVPCSNSEFDEVKGDTLLSICIAGEIKWGVSYFVSPFIKLAFMCETLTEHTSIVSAVLGYVTHFYPL